MARNQYYRDWRNRLPYVLLRKALRPLPLSPYQTRFFPVIPERAHQRRFFNFLVVLSVLNRDRK